MREGAPRTRSILGQTSRELLRLDNRYEQPGPCWYAGRPKYCAILKPTTSPQEQLHPSICPRCLRVIEATTDCLEMQLPFEYYNFYILIEPRNTRDRYQPINKILLITQVDEKYGVADKYPIQTVKEDIIQ